jgi:hypothetical protein
MAEIVLDAQSTPSTPAANKVVFSPFSGQRLENTNFLESRDEGAFRHKANRRTNFSTTSQSIPTAVETYITGSQLALSPQFLSLSAAFRWRFTMTKTAAGTAASTIFVKWGAYGTTTDIAMMSFTKPVGTAAVDGAWVDIYATQRLGASGGQFRSMNGFCLVSHNLNATGHMTIPFAVLRGGAGLNTDLTYPNTFLGVTLTTGASDVVTIQMVQAEGWNI